MAVFVEGSSCSSRMATDWRVSMADEGKVITESWGKTSNVRRWRPQQLVTYRPLSVGNRPICNEDGTGHLASAVRRRDNKSSWETRPQTMPYVDASLNWNVAASCVAEQTAALWWDRGWVRLWLGRGTSKELGRDLRTQDPLPSRAYHSF